MKMINNSWIKNILIPFLLVVPILWFVSPAITMGTENLRMIAYFDNDEACLVEFAGKTYSQGLIPIQSGAGYPQFFYYMAGIVLVPFTLLKGVNYQAIVIGLRCLNVLVAFSTVIFLYFFALRYLKSIWAAIMCCILLITMPNYLSWTVNSRPHILAVLFTLVSLFFCFKMVEIDKPKYFWGAVLFSAFAAATNLLFGFVMILAIWIANTYNSNRLQTPQLVEDLKSKHKIVSFIASFIVVFSASFFILGFFVLVKYQGLFYRSKLHGVYDFLRIRNVRMLIVLVAILLLIGIIWLIVNNYLRRIANNDKLSQGYRSLFIANYSCLALFYIVSVVAIVFLVLTPTYWLFPFASGKVIASQSILTTMSTSVDPGINKPIFDFDRFIWLKMLFDQQLLGIWIGLIFFCYLIYEIVFLKRNWAQNKRFLLQRGIIWIYMLTLMTVLVLLFSHRPHHYLLPIAVISIFLISYGIGQIIGAAKMPWAKNLLIIIFGLILAAGFYSRGNEIIKFRSEKMAKTNDAAISLGGWLMAHYPGNISLWKDNETLYIPPKFVHVYYPLKPDFANLTEIRRVNPNLFVLTSASLETQIIALSRRGAISRYQKVKSVKYGHDFKGLKEITVLVKK